MRTGMMIARRAIVAACAGATLAVGSATAAPGAFEVELRNRLVRVGMDKRIYQDLFKQAMPANTALDTIKVQGKLSTVGINYNIPGSGLPEVPAVGDQQMIENCGFEPVESSVNLATEVRNSASWSREQSLSTAFETSVEMEVGYDSPFGLSASVKTGLSFSTNQATTTGQTKSAERTQRYSLTKTVVTQPGTVSKAQLVYGEKTAKSIGYTARYQCTGKTTVTFVSRNLTPSNEALIGLAGKCLDVRGASRSPGAEVILWPCHGRENQRWTYNPATREIRGLAGHCLDVRGSSTERGTAVIVWPCHGGPNQKWTIAAKGEIKGLGGLCLDVKGNNSGDGTRIIMWPCHGGANQKWGTHSNTKTGTVDIEKYLSVSDRTIAVNGVFDGLYTSSSSSFRVADVKLSESYCAKVREELGIGDYGVASRSLPKVPISRSLPKPGSAVAMTARTVKDRKPSYVVVRKPTVRGLKAEKPLPPQNALK